MSPKRLFIKLVFLFLVLQLNAQEKRNEVFLADTMLQKITTSFQERGYYTIQENWKYHPGDNAAWALPEFNDSAWEDASTLLKLDSLPRSGWSGAGWFRLRLSIDSSLLNKPLAVHLLSHLGASEIYIDGKRFCQYGKVGTSVRDEQGLNTLTVVPCQVVFTTLQHLIAIRYSGFAIMKNRPPTLNEAGFSFGIGDAVKVNQQNRLNAMFFRRLEAGVVAIPLVFALIHLMLFLFYRREKSNFYFALFAFAISLWGFLEHESIGNTNSSLVLLLKRLWLPYIALMPVTGLLFLYSLFYENIPRRFWFFVIVALIIAALSWFTVLQLFSSLLFIISFAEMLRIPIVAIRKKISGAWIIGAGFVAFCISLLVLFFLMATDRFSLSLFYILIYVTGVLPLLLSMSVFLSRKISGTHKDLELEMKKSFQLEAENTRKEAELKKAAELKEAYRALEEAHEKLKSTQAQLIQSEKMASLGELTAGIAHEIQNPLNFVNNFSEVNTELIDELKSELATGNMQSANEIADDIKENSEKINHHGKRADAIVKGMLQHSRSSSGQKEPTDINALCDEYLRLAYHGLRAKNKSFNATMKTDFDETIGNINIIPQDMGRVILNLITNAFYAVMEKKKEQPEAYEPSVNVSTKKVKDRIEIRVADNGKGIPQNIIDKIFQPFFTTKPTGQGTGLGLSLSYDIVKAHGGELKVETKENEGSVFIIQLPTN